MTELDRIQGGLGQIDKKALFDMLELSEENLGAHGGEWFGSGTLLDVITPIDGSVIAKVKQCTVEEYDKVAERAHQAFLSWRTVPAPRRGQVVREIGEELRRLRKPLGALVSLEMGKIRAEGEGEVQEMIDICDFAQGLSRQLYGMTTHSERPGHRMYEQWHPLGVVGVITAFNFPVAVWSWNSALAWVCGDAVLDKPSSQTPLTAIACTKIAARVFEQNGFDPALSSLVVGKGSTVGDRMLHDKRLPLISATGSCTMGYRVGSVVGERLGRTILELGGNNAIIVSPHADMDMSVRAILFGAVGTAGQRCTSTRRIICHQSIFDTLRDRLVAAYQQVKIGDPLAEGTLMGPLVNQGAVDDMMKAIVRIKEEGGTILYGGEHLTGAEYPGGCYVSPCIAEAKNEYEIVQEETFAPILYLIRYQDIDEAIALHNGVPQGLSSSIFTTNLLEAEQFLSHAGSDCGIANVNIGTSGAEIGGAFGGEKETGGGRESGSDAWRAYMRRQTNTINWSRELPLAQGITFGG
ncbi:MAG: aldehyde dehydrogenase family protein [Deltaproteobacteria bacterium]|jgi:aldehyde dehydrogenase (NAD+)|nr:aldehyde dehydrogenase family protein [Deltaproteobacteria bacterium]MBW2536543.1 aldehyde dehydrogenase family protein [Deltaproteobacteria bacterium]